MRAIFGSATIMWLVVGCGTDKATTAPVEQPALEITSNDLVIHPGEETTKCFYFHTDNADRLTIHKWVSDMTPGSHHMIYFVNNGSQPADGTLDTSGCGVGGGGGANVPIWTYATQTPHQEMQLPTDDGAGKPLAQKIPPNTGGYFQMHYLNATDQPLTAHVNLKAYGLPDSTAYTQTDAYVTYNNDISIPPHATGFQVSATCPIPPGVKFWTVSTHAHKQAVKTDINDGSSNIFESTDWEHPGAKSWMATPFYSFSGTSLTWTCTSDNTGDNAARTVVAGSSAQTNEMCMATGYFFPSTGPKFEVKYNGSCVAL